MTHAPKPRDKQPAQYYRLMAWGLAALLLVLPLVAMQFTDEVRWGSGDFLLFGILLLGSGILFELGFMKDHIGPYRWALTQALIAVILLVWVNGAVGILGSEGSAANLAYYAVIVIILCGVFLTGLEPRGMARTMFAAGLLLLIITITALISEFTGPPFASLLLSGFFMIQCFLSAYLFRIASRRHTKAE